VIKPDQPQHLGPGKPEAARPAWKIQQPESRSREIILHLLICVLSTRGLIQSEKKINFFTRNKTLLLAE
jgi:hypothetical protein